jgi:hypothetical protein
MFLDFIFSSFMTCQKKRIILGRVQVHVR